MRTRPGSPQALPYAAPYAARFESRAIAHLWRRRPAGEESAAGTRSAGPRWMTSACGGGGERVGGRSKARHSAVTAAGCARLSPLDVQCVFIKNQYRSVLIGSSSPREGACVRAGVCACVWGCGSVGVWGCGGVGQGQQRGSSDKCLIVISRWSGSPQTTSDSSSCIIL